MQRKASYYNDEYDDIPVSVTHIKLKASFLDLTHRFAVLLSTIENLALQTGK